MPHTPVKVPGELVHCSLISVFVFVPLTQVEFSKWTGAGSMFV